MIQLQLRISLPRKKRTESSLTHPFSFLLFFVKIRLFRNYILIIQLCPCLLHDLRTAMRIKICLCLPEIGNDHNIRIVYRFTDKIMDISMLFPELFYQLRMFQRSDIFFPFPVFYRQGCNIVGHRSLFLSVIISLLVKFPHFRGTSSTVFISGSYWSSGYMPLQRTSTLHPSLRGEEHL